MCFGNRHMDVMQGCRSVSMACQWDPVSWVSPVQKSQNWKPSFQFTIYVDAIASCATADSALSEIDSLSITMPVVMSSEDVFTEVRQLLSSMTDGTLKCEDLSYSPSLTEIQSKLTARKKELQSHRTSRLWLQYLDIINLLKMHRNAERTGQWEEQLHVLKSM